MVPGVLCSQPGAIPAQPADPHGVQRLGGHLRDHLETHPIQPGPGRDGTGRDEDILRDPHRVGALGANPTATRCTGAFTPVWGFDSPAGSHQPGYVNLAWPQSDGLSRTQPTLTLTMR